MRLLSQYARYSIVIFGPNEKIMTDERGYAVMVPQNEPVIAMFDKLGLLDHEQDLVLRSFDFSGLPEGVHPLTRVGVWDSEAYCFDKYSDPEERASMQAQIDQRCRELQPRFPTQFVIAETPVAPLPWPSYEEDTIEDILKLQERLGYDPDLVRRYEEENQNRPEVIGAMQELIGTAPQEEITVDA